MEAIAEFTFQINPVLTDYSTFLEVLHRNSIYRLERDINSTNDPLLSLLIKEQINDPSYEVEWGATGGVNITLYNVPEEMITLLLLSWKR